MTDRRTLTDERAHLAGMERKAHPEAAAERSRENVARIIEPDPDVWEGDRMPYREAMGRRLDARTKADAIIALLFGGSPIHGSWKHGRPDPLPIGHYRLPSGKRPPR